MGCAKKVVTYDYKYKRREVKKKAREGKGADDKWHCFPKGVIEIACTCHLSFHVTCSLNQLLMARALSSCSKNSPFLHLQLRPMSR